MPIDPIADQTQAAAVRGDPAAIEALDTEIAAGRDSGDYARVDAALMPIVTAAADGDAQALDLLLRCINVHRLAQAPVRKLLIDERDVDDAVQTTLIQVSKAIGSFEGRSRFTTWLYRIAEREALQVLRRNKNVAAPTDDDLSGLADEVRRMSSVVVSRAMIRQALSELDPKFRDPVVLCDVEGLEYAAIAERLRIPLNTVKTRIMRGRQYVADRMLEAQRSGGSLG